MLPCAAIRIILETNYFLFFRDHAEFEYSEIGLLLCCPLSGHTLDLMPLVDSDRQLSNFTSVIT